MEIIENSISSTRVLNGTFSFSGGVVIVGALRTTLLLGPLVYGSIIEIRKNRGGSPKRSIFSVHSKFLDILLTHVGLANAFT